MAKELQAQILKREIRIHIVIPEKFLQEFFISFGDLFRHDNPMALNNLKPVDGYYETSPHSRYFNVQVSVHEALEERFREFLKCFCESREINLSEQA